MCVVKGSEGDNKEGCGVFPSVNQVREGPFGVTVAPQTLDETEPSRKTLDHCTDTIGVGITHIFTCKEVHTQPQTHKQTQSVSLVADKHPEGYH